MIERESEITGYKIYFRTSPSTWNFAPGTTLFPCLGFVLCKGGVGYEDLLWFPILSDETTPLPRPTSYFNTIINTLNGYMPIRMKDLPKILDILRHEKPLTMFISEAVPDANALVTPGFEPIGEGDVDLSP